MQDQEEPRRSEAGDGRIVCGRRLFVSPAQECKKNDGSGSRGLANEQEGRKGRRGTVDGGTARERKMRLDEALGKREGKSKMRRQLNGHQKLVRRRMVLSSRCQT